MDKWTAHRLPKFGDLDAWGKTLVTTADGDVKIAYWNGNGWEIKGTGWCESETVVAWMPCPEPYKVSSQSGCETD